MGGALWGKAREAHLEHRARAERRAERRVGRKGGRRTCVTLGLNVLDEVVVALRLVVDDAKGQPH